MTAPPAWMTADEAAARLGVGRATLYAYVSRGFVRSQALAPGSRARSYAREDVERLRRRSEERRHPDTATARALDWGLPVLESSLTFIDGRRLYYRGHDAVELSRTRSIAEVASLIWTGRLDGDISAPAADLPPLAAALRRLSFVPRAQATLAAAGAGDPGAFDTRASVVACTGWRIVGLLTAVAAQSAMRPREAIERTLARAWRVDGRAADVLRAAMILCADHELNVSAFTARAVASAGAHPYAVVIAGLSALEGTRHGGASARVEAMLDGLRRARSIRAALADRLRRGEPVHGVGHPLYRDGDPRAAEILSRLRAHAPRSAEVRFVSAVAAAAAEVAGERPNLDFALAALARALRLPRGSPLVLFAIGRTIGWIGHAIEQYGTGQLIRPRAKYVGVVPAAEA